ncbi:MAG: hypothetical protein A2X02_07905 [Bacteroidetes bacterium GWF2_29_10]|nr:MAG: hypothetical protein A2X02_07905 [Bacteroidetes bacterium GWF2_29_10]
MRLISLLFGLLILLSNFYVKAQKFGGGYILAFSSTQIAGDRLSGFSKSGIATGLFVSSKIKNKISAEMQMLLIQKGSRTKANAEYFYKVTLNYIEVPINLRYNLNKRMSIYGGFGIAYLFKSIEKDIDGEIVYTPPFRKTELAMQIGGNYLIKNNLYFDVRLSNSIIPIRTYGYGYPYMNFDQYNTGIYFGLKYFFSKEK